MAKDGHCVFYVFAKPLDNLPIDETDPLASTLMDKNILRNIFFKYYDDPGALLKTLLEMHMASVKPRLIIVDFLHKFYDELDTLPSANLKDTFYREFICKHMLIMATIQNTVDTLAKQFNSQCVSIVCLDTGSNSIYNRFKQQIVDFYYYEENVIFNTGRHLLESFDFDALK